MSNQATQDIFAEKWSFDRPGVDAIVSSVNRLWPGWDSENWQALLIDHGSMGRLSVLGRRVFSIYQCFSLFSAVINKFTSHEWKNMLLRVRWSYIHVNIWSGLQILHAVISIANCELLSKLILSDYWVPERINFRHSWNQSLRARTKR